MTKRIMIPGPQTRAFNRAGASSISSKRVVTSPTLPCQAGYTCKDGVCQASSPDAGTQAGALVLDDFEDTNLRSNTFGGIVTWNNAQVTLAGGEQSFTWNGFGTSYDFIESFRADWCGIDLSGYTKLSFRMGATVANKRVAIVLGIEDGSCGLSFGNRVNTVVVGTSTTAYEIDISRTTRTSVRSIDFVPTMADSTTYFLDDIVLIP